MPKTSLPCYPFYTPGDWCNPPLPGVSPVVSGGYFRDMVTYNVLGPVIVYRVTMLNINDQDYMLPNTTIRDGEGGEIKFVTPFTWGGQAPEGYDSCKSINVIIPGNGIRFTVGPYMDPVESMSSGYNRNYIQLVYE